MDQAAELCDARFAMLCLETGGKALIDLDISEHLMSLSDQTEAEDVSEHDSLDCVCSLSAAPAASSSLLVSTGACCKNRNIQHNLIWNDNVAVKHDVQFPAEQHYPVPENQLIVRQDHPKVFA